MAAGKIDQVAGLAFAIRDVGNYFVLRINALEDNFALFEYVNGKRFLRVISIIAMPMAWLLWSAVTGAYPSCWALPEIPGRTWSPRCASPAPS